MTSGDDLRGGGRFSITAHDDPPRLVKRGDPAALAREARALRAFSGTGIAPTLIASRPGELTVGRLPGTPRALDGQTPAQLRRLGATLRQLHDMRRQATGGRHVWPTSARSLQAYAHRRLADLTLPRELHALDERIGAAFTPQRSQESHPFRLLHGDLVEQNIIWSPGPVLVDWEFWRTGDPAEDLAYLVTVNDLTATTEAAILAGYADPAMRGRIAPWRALCALDAGIWYEHEGRHDLAANLVQRASTLATTGERR